MNESICVTRRHRTRAALLRVALAIATVLALAVGSWSCAVPSQTQGGPASMPAARSSMRPEYRLFHDALVDYGEWVLIEPFGFVFRPRVAPDFWNPYWDGFWSPTDQYGWVWVSAEPFGWATYHYGRWYRDPYQGWVWLPGLDWAPAWVTWSATEDYVGWAPLGPGSVWTNAAVSGSYQFAPRASMGSTSLKTVVVRGENAADLAAAARPVENPDTADGVTYNAGPSVEWVEQRTGRLARVKLEDVLPQRAAETKAIGDGGFVDAKSKPGEELRPRQAAEIATQRARDIMQKKANPQSIPMVRPSREEIRGSGGSPSGFVNGKTSRGATADSTKK